MRNLIAILCFSFLAFACEKEEVTTLPVPGDGIQLQLHAIIACGSTFDRGDESPEEWKQRIIDQLIADGITILEYELDFVEVEHIGFCGNCSPTGDILKITAATEDEAALRALGFRD